MLEGYITPLLMSYIDKYVKNIKPSDLKLSFWGGDAVLHNLELRLDVLERELRVPVEFKSGCIRELTLHIPWNAIGSSSVRVDIKDLEFVIRLKPLRGGGSTSGQSVDSEASSSETKRDASLTPPAPVPPPADASSGSNREPAPGYLQGYLNRIVNNVRVHVQNVVIKVVQEELDLMLTFNIDSVDFFTANDQWEREFVYTDYFQDAYSLHKALKVSAMTVNLHPIEIREKDQGSLLHEPFVNRLSFTWKMTSEYQGKTYVRKIWDVVIDTIEFSVDENQFCLFLHFLDWLLCLYYSGKKLKGRDKNPYKSSASKPKPGGVSERYRLHNVDARGGGGEMAEPKISSSTESRTDPPSEVPTQQDVGGWGTWLLSYIGSSESEEFPPPDATRPKDEEIPKDARNQTETRFVISARTVTVFMKMTQQVQVPVFRRSFTSPVLRVVFDRCMLRVDKSPLTRLFLVCMGVGGVRAEVMGLCPCVKKFPLSWRRTSATSLVDAGKMVSTV